MNREDFIRFIPKPSNEDVILYDVSLKDLIDIDVVKEYHKLLPVFKEKKNDFLKLKQEIDTYMEIINQLFLFNPSWSEETYLQKLQDDMRTYSLLYGDIKRKEDEINIFKRKIEAINDKIIIQKNKEERENEEKQANINNEIEKNKADLIKLNDNLQVYRNSFRRLEEQLKNFKSDLKMLKTSMDQLKKGKYECFCCGKTINKNEAKDIINKINLNMQKNTQELNSILEEKAKIQNAINYYKEELSRIKIELKNNLAFKSNYKNMYIKKSIEILKLEASRNECLEKITQMEQNLKNEPQANSKKFLELKNRIEKYKISLENLQKTRTMKSNTSRKINTYEQNKNKIKDMETLILKYLSFLRIYYKIYEQKSSQYAGVDYKIKLFEIINYDIIETLEIFYKGIEYSQLSKKDKDLVDKNLAEKFLSDF